MNLEPLLQNEVPYLIAQGSSLPERPIFLPGSFNPFHEGHEKLLRVACKKTQCVGTLELSISNVDKPDLTSAELEIRLASIPSDLTVILTNAPTFIQKARCFPNRPFVLGFDTAIRLLDPKYHADILGMLAEFRALKTRFLVAGRSINQTFYDPFKLNIPKGFEELFLQIPEAVFRVDLSSTELRG